MSILRHDGEIKDLQKRVKALEEQLAKKKPGPKKKAADAK